MPETAKSRIDRRKFLKLSAATGAATFASLESVAWAQTSTPLNMMTWSAAVDTVKSHLSAFEKKTGIYVAYGNMPWAQYRDGMVTKFVGGAPLDMMWVSDAWLPEWVEAGWIAPIDEFDFLMKYNADAESFCTNSMTYKGHQYGLTYYTDYMGFLYNESMLKAAGFDHPPASWDELVEQSVAMKSKGISDFPMMLAMAQESWQIEFISALVFSHGGSLTNDKGDSTMTVPGKGAIESLQWVVDAVRKHKIISPSCVETGELEGLKAFSSGSHAFAMLPKYRLRMLNDPKQSKIAGHAKQALMPMGKDGSHATVGWMRFYGMSAQAAKDKTRASETARLIEWYGGKSDGAYTFQKLLFLDIGAGFGVKSLFDDPEIRASYGAYGDVHMIKAQQALARKKDVISPWFGQWNETNGAAWQKAILGNVESAAAIKSSSDLWDKLKSEH